MEYNVTTTGRVASINITDIDTPISLKHPITIDLLELATLQEINESSIIQTAINERHLLATDEFGIPIPAQPVDGTVTIKKTIGNPSYDPEDYDFLFTSAANGTAQNLNMGAIIPAFARVLDIKLICTETIAGATTPTMQCALGNASAGTQFASLADCDTLNDVVALGTGAMPTTNISASASNIWVQGDVATDNWDDLTAGSWELQVTYIPKID